jgi:uncharacterized phiE125 gp8 family phage protein
MQILRDVSVLTDPTDVVITLAEAKNYLRVDFDDDDVLIQATIDSAIRRLEQYGSFAMTTRQLQAIAYVDYIIELPYTPISSITKVEFFNGTDWTQLSEGGDYVVFGINYKKVRFNTYRGREFRFTYTCGFTDLPHIIKQATLKLIADLYDYRQSESPSTHVSENQMTAYEMIEPYKRTTLFL